jgi:hypothetical protein
MIPRAALWSAVSLIALTATPQARPDPAPTTTYVLDFWPGPRLVNGPLGKTVQPLSRVEMGVQARLIDRRVRSVHPHPCGQEIEARVSRIPTPTDAVLVPEMVQELDSRGQTIRKWFVPIDTWPIGIESNRLKIEHRSGYLWIDADRRLAPAEYSDEEPWSRRLMRQCPFDQELLRSKKGVCTLFDDLETGRARFIVLPVMCT